MQTFRIVFILFAFLFHSSKVIYSTPKVVKADYSGFSKLNGWDSDSLFFEAVISGDIGKVKSAIEGGVDINQFHNDGETPLFKAVSYKNLEVLNLLLENDANPNLTMKNGLEATSLMWSVADPNLSISSRLIDFGADVNVIDIQGDHALNWATYYGNVKQMEMLMNAGADLSLTSKHGTAVDVAFRLWHSDSVHSVFKHTKIAYELKEDEYLLAEAVNKGDVEIVVSLLGKNGNPDLKDELGTPILQLAAQSGNIEIVEILLKNGADSNGLNRVGQSPLAFAARFNEQDIVELLLRNGADPNASGEKYQLSPLIGAAVNGNISIGKKLLESGADIHHTDIVNQSSALHWALFYGNTEFAKFLIEEGANYSIKALGNSQNAEEIALMYGFNNVVDFINKKKWESNPLSGSWSLSQIHYQYADTTYKLEKAKYGALVVAPYRYSIMYSPIESPRTPFVSLANPTDEEIKHAFQSLAFNSGTYEILDSVLVTTSDMARVPGFEGGKQYFRFQILNKELKLVMFDETYPDGTKPDWYNKLKILFIFEKE